MLFAAIGSRILAGDRHFACQALSLHGLKFTQSCTVIGSDYAIDLVLLRGEDVLHHLLGIGGIPVFHPLIGDDFDDALVDIGLNDFHLAIANQVGIIVGR